MNLGQGYPFSNGAIPQGVFPSDVRQPSSWPMAPVEMGFQNDAIYGRGVVSASGPAEQPMYHAIHSLPQGALHYETQPSPVFGYPRNTAAGGTQYYDEGTSVQDMMHQSFGVSGQVYYLKESDRRFPSGSPDYRPGGVQPPLLGEMNTARQFRTQGQTSLREIPVPIGQQEIRPTSDKTLPQYGTLEKRDLAVPGLAHSEKKRGGQRLQQNAKLSDDNKEKFYLKLNATRKTELCRWFEETGSCPYSDKCRFAHGKEELQPRPDFFDHDEKDRFVYKTKRCKNFYGEAMMCYYGQRCKFRHGDVSSEIDTLFLPRTNVASKHEKTLEPAALTKLNIQRALDENGIVREQMDSYLVSLLGSTSAELCDVVNALLRFAGEKLHLCLDFEHTKESLELIFEEDIIYSQLAEDSTHDKITVPIGKLPDSFRWRLPIFIERGLSCVADGDDCRLKELASEVEAISLSGSIDSSEYQAKENVRGSLIGSNVNFDGLNLKPLQVAQVSQVSENRRSSFLELSADEQSLSRLQTLPRNRCEPLLAADCPPQSVPRFSVPSGQRANRRRKDNGDFGNTLRSYHPSTDRPPERAIYPYGRPRLPKGEGHRVGGDEAHQLSSTSAKGIKSFSSDPKRAGELNAAPLYAIEGQNQGHHGRRTQGRSQRRYPGKDQYR